MNATFRPMNDMPQFPLGNLAGAIENMFKKKKMYLQLGFHFLHHYLFSIDD